MQRFIFYYLNVGAVVTTLEQEDKEQSAFVTVLSFYLTNLYPKTSWEVETHHKLQDAIVLKSAQRINMHIRLPGQSQLPHKNRHSWLETILPSILPVQPPLQFLFLSLPS